MSVRSVRTWPSEIDSSMQCCSIGAALSLSIRRGGCDSLECSSASAVHATDVRSTPWCRRSPQPRTLQKRSSRNDTATFPLRTTKPDRQMFDAALGTIRSPARRCVTGSATTPAKTQAVQHSGSPRSSCRSKRVDRPKLLHRVVAHRPVDLRHSARAPTASSRGSPDRNRSRTSAQHSHRRCSR